MAISVLAACRPSGDVEVTEEGWLQRGTDVATDSTLRIVQLDGRALTLEIERGSITLRGADVAEARFEFIRTARARGAAAAAERLQTVTIDEEGATDRYEIRARTDRQRATEVHLRATLPLDAHVTIRVGRGDVRLSDLGGSLEVEADNGRVEAADLTASSVHVRTGRGDQTVDFRVLSRGAEIRLRADNGDLDLTLPQDGSAEISVETGLGSIGAHDLTLTRERFEERRNDTRYRARLGDGGARVVAEAGVGHVRLRGRAPMAGEPP